MRLSRLPVRVRLVAGFALAMVVVLAGAGGFVFWRVQVALDHRLDEDLAGQTADLQVVARHRPPAAALTALAAQGRDAQLIAADGRVLGSGSGLTGRGSLLSPDEARAARTRTVRTGRGNLFSDRGIHVRVLAVPVHGALAARGREASNGGAAVAVTAVHLDQRDEALRELLLQLAVANGIALALASLVGYRLARGALDPVERYRAQAERIARGASGVRIDVPTWPDDEISRLGTTLNAMLDAQQRAADRQQQFVDDASHELRTPLGALSAEVELALGRPRTGQELTDALRRIATDTTRLTTLTDELLTLGALGSGVPAAEALQAQALLDEAARRARDQLREDDGRPVLVDAPTGLVVSGDPALLARALGNLVDNAVRHGRGTISLTASALEGIPRGAVLGVHDEGVLAADFLAHASERFRRGQSSRTGPGTGLGLALVEAIVAAHDGQLRVCSDGAHYLSPTPDEQLAAAHCQHPEQGTTVSLLLSATAVGRAAAADDRRPVADAQREDAPADSVHHR